MTGTNQSKGEHMKRLIPLALAFFLLAPSAGAENVEGFFEDTIQPIREQRTIDLETIEESWEDWKDFNDGLVGEASHDETVERVRERNTAKDEVNRQFVRDTVDAQREFQSTEDTRRPKEPRTPRTPRLPSDVR